MTRSRSRLPLPPAHAERFETVCPFCSVGCGYTAFRWPSPRYGGPAPQRNALGVDYRVPQAPLTGRPYTESMYAEIRHRGRPHRLALVPSDASPVNRACDHSSRGGSRAQSTYAPQRSTHTRLTRPQLRVGETWVDLEWREAEALLAEVLANVIDDHGADAVAAKTFDHGGGGGGFENNFAVGRLLFEAIGTQSVSIHNRPGYNSEVWGSRDRGVHELNASLEDARLADTLVLWGANPFETATVLFTSHLLPNLRGETASEKQLAFGDEARPPTRVVLIDPRRTATVVASEAAAPGRVLHLRPRLGTDVVLADALARVVYEEGWSDRSFIEARTDPESFESYRRKSLRLDVPYARVLAEASRFTEIPIALIVTAARWMAEPKSATTRRRTLTYYEKGVIWNHRNLDTVAAVVQLSALAGNLGRPGTGCSRQGGHQEGYVRPPYPGPRPPPNVDAWLARGGGRLFWVMGSNPFLSTPGATEFARSMTERVRRVDHALTSAGASKSSRAKRIREALSSGDGLFMVVSELYPTATAKAAHLILPAAGWGEMDLTSISCHGRLLRLYSAFMDPPGEARPDWAIAAGVARAVRKLYLKRGRTKDARRFAGFDWKEAEDVFLAGGETFPDNRVDASGGDQLPAECYRGVTYDRLRELGQTGIPTPVRQDPKSGELVGTVRRYTHRFNTSDGRFRWHGSAPWDGHPAAVEKYLSGTRARKHPFWLTNGRTQRWWQTGFHDALDEDKRASVPYPFVEVHPEDARELRIETGDLVALFNEEGRETFQARIAHSTKRGVLFALQYHARGSSNALVSTSAVDPTTTIPYYKGTRVGLSRLSTRPDAKPSKIAPNVLE